MSTRAILYSGIAFLTAGAILVIVSDATAQREATSKTSANSTPTRRRANRQPMAWTPAREAAAYTFAKVNHPELADLLDRLKSTKKNRRAYQRAIRQLYFDSERLARLKDLDGKSKSKRYGVALNLWKLDSRIRLLTAQVAMSQGKNKELESQLDAALKERIDLRIAQMEADHARTLERAKKLKQQIDKIKNDKDKAAAVHLQRVKRGLGLKRKRTRAKNKNRRRPMKGKKTDTP